MVLNFFCLPIYVKIHIHHRFQFRNRKRAPAESFLLCGLSARFLTAHHPTLFVIESILQFKMEKCKMVVRLPSVLSAYLDLHKLAVFSNFVFIPGRLYSVRYRIWTSPKRKRRLCIQFGCVGDVNLRACREGFWSNCCYTAFLATFGDAACFAMIIPKRHVHGSLDPIDYESFMLAADTVVHLLSTTFDVNCCVIEQRECSSRWEQVTVPP